MTDTSLHKDISDIAEHSSHIAMHDDRRNLTAAKSAYSKLDVSHFQFDIYSTMILFLTLSNSGPCLC